MADLLLDHDRLKKQTIHTDDTGFTIKTVWDEKPFLDHCANMRQFGVQEKRMGRYVGSIPMPLLGEWLKEDPELLDKKGALLKKLREREYSKLRVVDRSRI